MRQPGVDASGPLLQIQCRKRWVINLLQSDQNITYLSLGMADHATVGLKASYASPELHPHGFRLIEDIFQGDGCPSPGGNSPEPEGMRRKSQEEVIGYFFQENQVWHREIMGIVTNQALDAILTQQVIEQVFAFAPASSRSHSQCPQEQVSQRRFPRIIFGSRHCQDRIAPSSNHSSLACRLISEVANAHRFARARLGHNDMPASLEPCLT